MALSSFAYGNLLWCFFLSSFDLWLIESEDVGLEGQLCVVYCRCSLISCSSACWQHLTFLLGSFPSFIPIQRKCRATMHVLHTALLSLKNLILKWSDTNTEGRALKRPWRVSVAEIPRDTPVLIFLGIWLCSIFFSTVSLYL